MASTRNENVCLAKVAAKAQRYKDMVEFAVKIVDAAVDGGDDLTIEERNILTMSFKCVIAARLTTWLCILDNEREGDSVKEYRSKVEADMTSICYRIINLLDSKLIESAASADSKAFYLKMKGDYYKYLADFKIGDEKREAAENGRSAYMSAQDIAKKDLPPTHPTRLGIAFNFSMFCYDILESSEFARNLAKEALDEANAKLYTLCTVPYYSDSLQTMKLLQKNVELWS